MKHSRLHTLTFLATLSFCAAGLTLAKPKRPTATLASASNGLVFLAVDGKDFENWQTRISVSPGPHDVTMGVNIGWESPTGPKSKLIPAPVKRSFKAGHEYSFRVKMLTHGQLEIKVTDDTENELRRANSGPAPNISSKRAPSLEDNDELR